MDPTICKFKATKAPEELCRMIRKNGMKPGVAVKPGTSIDTIIELVDASLVDLVLIMTVEPGFGGQKFMGDMMTKVCNYFQASYASSHVLLKFQIKMKRLTNLMFTTLRLELCEISIHFLTLRLTVV